MGTFGINRIYTVGRVVKVADRMRWGVCSRAGSIPSVSQMQNSSGWPTSIIHCDVKIHYYVYTYYCTLEGITISVIEYPRIDDVTWLSENWWRRLTGCRRNFFHTHPELSRRSLSTIHRKKTLACQKVLYVKLWSMLFGMFCCDVLFVMSRVLTSF